MKENSYYARLAKKFPSACKTKVKAIARDGNYAIITLEGFEEITLKISNKKVTPIVGMLVLYGAGLGFTRFISVAFFNAEGDVESDLLTQMDNGFWQTGNINDILHI